MTDRFKLFLYVSCTAHVIAILSCFRISYYNPGVGEEPPATTEQSPYVISKFTGERPTDVLKDLSLVDTIPGDTSRTGNDRWRYPSGLYPWEDPPTSGGELPPGMYSSPPGSILSMDESRGSLETSEIYWAYSELLREKVFEIVMYQLDQPIYSGSNIDWEGLVRNLSDRIDQAHRELEEKDHYLDPLERDVVQAVADSANLEAWEQAMMISLRQEASDRLIEAIEKTVEKSIEECKGGGSAGDRQDGQPGKRTTGDRRSSPSELEKRIENELKRYRSSLGWTTTLFPRFDFFADYAMGFALEMAADDSETIQLIEGTDFKKAIHDGLGLSERISARGRSGPDLFQEIASTLDTNSAHDLAITGPGGVAWLRGNRYHVKALAGRYLRMFYGYSTSLLKYDMERYLRLSNKVRCREIEEPPVQGYTQPPANAIDLEYSKPGKIYLPTMALQDTSDRKESHPLLSPGFPSNAFGAAVRTTRPVMIDGVLEEWEDCRPYRLQGKIKGFDTIPDQFGDCAYLMVKWDNRGLYFAYWLRDSRDNSGSTRFFWAGDSFELFFDPLNRKDLSRSEESNHQYWIWPRERGTPGSTGQSVFSGPTSFQPRPLRSGVIDFASRRDEAGYTCEVFFPSTLLNRFYPNPGSIIGFNYSINNGQNIYIRWLTNMGENISFHPSLWGDLLLMGSDATLHLEPKEFLLPGEKVDVTVIDPDMDLDRDRADKILVIARSQRTGDQITLFLVENETDSGVFSGRMGTAFGRKSLYSNRLNAAPGDIVTLYYVDRFASGGRRNVVVTGQIPVGKAVYSLKSSR